MLVAGLAVWFATGPARRRAKARHDVAEIQFALTGYAQLYGSVPTGSPAEIAAVLLGKDMREQDPRFAPILEASGYEMNSLGEFVDPWGTPYRIVPSPTVYVYSCGPDRIDELGAGDDIAAGL